MKAWEVSIKNDSEKGSVIVWSENQSKAKSTAYELEADCFTDLRAKRCKWADNLSSLTDEEMLLEKLKHDWTCYDVKVSDTCSKYIPYLNSDDVYGIEKLGLNNYLKAKHNNDNKFMTPNGWII